VSIYGKTAAVREAFNCKLIFIYNVKMCSNEMLKMPINIENTQKIITKV